MMSDVIDAIFDSLGSTAVTDVPLEVCPICGGKKEHIITFNGRMRKVPCMCRCDEAAYEEEKRKRQEEEDMRRLQEIRGASLMDSKFYDATFDKFQETTSNGRNYQYCKRYAENFKRFLDEKQGLLFWGSVGTGKSYAAACIANELLSKGTPVIMTSFVRVVDMFYADKETDIIARLNRAKLVVFDDLGAERGTDYALEKVYDVVDSRYRSGLPMIVTTNMTMQDMRAETDIRYKRIYDRIFEMCYPMNFAGDSWRTSMAKSRFQRMDELMRGEA